MLVDTRWNAWNEEITVQVTEGAALAPAARRVGALIAEAESASSLRRGDAEIHAVNLAQGRPVRVSASLARLLRSALWVARMTDGAVGPLAVEPPPSGVPSIHPEPTFEDVRIDDATVHAPYGAYFDITGTAKADTVGRAAILVAGDLECGVLVRIGAVVATGGHPPAGGWQVGLPGNTSIELSPGAALATAAAPDRDPDDVLPGAWTQVTVVTDDAVGAYGAATAALRRGVGAVSWLQEQELAARLVDRAGRVHTTSAWQHPHAA
ncbi:FAD:protein FMN transferase [Prescottella sp. R16]|uniref:FAD:protein FMN transferase n=1 Tax=Prescottella sp. R16 TaxID=3064529 RepID=UPI00272E0E98|nr:FAD:protein FMN transferase [Prescottella sp. R16]